MQIPVELFTKEFFEIFDETFEEVHGIYLDRNTSLFETLATVSSEEASRPVSERCACIAAQVFHVRFYLEVLESYMRGNPVGRVDWQESWQLKHVTPEEWDSLKSSLKDTYRRVRDLMKSFDTWQGEDDIAGALAVLVHSAYHLGEIRQALCTIKAA
jgi:hypothetical protein